jgi:uncharacterized protein
MLKVDLGQLDRKGRIRVDADVPPDDPVWETTGLRLADPVEVRLDVQRTGPDVLVRGRFSTAVHEHCRRCLRPLERPAEDELTLVYRKGLSEVEAEAQEVYAIGQGSQALDLGPALREHLILAMPRYPVCDESCQGLCPTCGQDLNVGPCDCGGEEPDPRWNALRELTK